MAEHELDVRTLRKPDKHPAIFRTYEELAVGGSFVLVNNHDPRHLRDEFEAEHPGSYGWAYLSTGPETWRIEITKLASTPLPRILADVTAIGANPDATGAIWKLQARERDLDSNVIALPASARIDTHNGPDIDVLIFVVGGTGELTTELGSVQLRAGALIWLPRRSRRQFTAGPDGLRYLTVHQRRQDIGLTIAPSAAAG
jgi:uncharacterized protein (DUF2249 family)